MLCTRYYKTVQIKKRMPKKRREGSETQRETYVNRRTDFIFQLLSLTRRLSSIIQLKKDYLLFLSITLLRGPSKMHKTGLLIELLAGIWNSMCTVSWQVCSKIPPRNQSSWWEACLWLGSFNHSISHESGFGLKSQPHSLSTALGQPFHSGCSATQNKGNHL